MKFTVFRLTPKCSTS